MENVDGTAKNSSELISEVAQKWDSLSEAQQRNTAVGISGIYQLSRWNALMLNYQMGLDATETSLNSYGSAMREQEKFNESLQARINRLTTAWYGFADALGGTVLYDAIVVGTETLTRFTNKAEDGSSSTLALSTSFGLLLAPLTLMSSRLTTFTGAIIQNTAQQIINGRATSTNTGSLLANQIQTVRNTVATKGFSGAMLTLAASSTAAGTALRSFLMMTGIGIGIVAVTALITTLTSKISENIQKQEEFDSMMEKNVSALTENKDRVNELMTTYESLSQVKERSAEQEKKYLDVQNQLAELFPALISHIDSSGQAHLKTGEALQNEIGLVNQLIEARKEEIKIRAQEIIGDSQSNVDDAQSEIKKVNDLIGNLKKSIERAKSGNPLYAFFDVKKAEKEIKSLEFGLRKLELEVSNVSQEMVGSILDIADAFSNIDIDSNVAREVENLVRSLNFDGIDPSKAEEFAQQLAKIREELSKALTSGNQEGFNKAKSDLMSLFETIDKDSSKVAKLGLDFEKLNTIVNQTSSTFASADDSIDGMSSSADALSEKIAELSEDILELKSVEEQLAGVSQNHVDSSQELLFLYEQLTNRLSGYNEQQLKELLDKPKLTAEEKYLVQAMQQRGDVIAQLSVLYPQYAKLQKDAIGLSKEQVKAMQEEEHANKVLLEAYGLASEGKLTAEQQMTLTQATATKARIDNIKQEIEALSILQKKLQETYNEQVKLQQQQDFNSLSEDEKYTYGYGAYRAGTVLGQTQSSIRNYTSELDNLKAQLNTNIGTISNFTTSIKNSEKASKSSSKSTKDSTKESIYITDQYKQAMEELTLAIEKQNKLQSDYPKHSAQYRSALKDELKLQKQKLDLMQAQAKSLDAQIKSGKIAQTGSVSDPKSGTSTTLQSSKVKVNGWNGRLTSGQGNRTLNGKSEPHRGIDLAMARGTRLDSNVSGKVIASGNASKNGYHSSYGNIVVVQDDSGYKHLFAHLDKAVAKIGSYIQAGTQVGNIGSTGNSTGSHLHYEVSNAKGVLQDAATFAKDARAGSVTLIQEVTSTTKAISNTQQSIDDAKSTLNGLQTDILSQQEKIAQIEQSIVDSYFDYYEFKRNSADKQLSHENAKLQTLNRTSSRYNKTLDLMVKYMNDKQKANEEELAYIDELISQGGLSATVIDNLTQRKLELKTAIHELNSEMQKFNLDRITEQYADLYDTIDDTLALEEAKLDNLNTSSNRYTQTLRNLADGYRDKYKAVENNIKALEKLISTNQVSGKNLEETVDKVNDLKVELENLHQQITTKNYEVIVNVKTQYDARIDDLQFEIERSQIIQGMYEEGTANYNGEIQKQIGWYNQIIKSYDEARRKLQAEMKQSELTAEQKKELMEQMEDLTLSYWNAKKAVDDLTKSLEESNKKMLEDIADAYINAYKEYVRERQDEHMKLLDDEMKREQERHDAIMKQYQEEMDLFRKNVQEKLDLIDRQEATRSYEMELDELEKDRKEIADKINLLSLDNSYEAKKKREKLLKELDDKDKEIAEHKHKRDIDLQKEALNDLLESKEEEMDAKEDLAQQEYDNLVKQLNRQKEYWQKYYTDLANDERKFAQIREDIMNGHFEKVNAEFQQYMNEMIATMPQLQDTMDGTMQAVGTAIRQNVIDQLREAMKMIEEYKAKQDSMSSINVPKYEDDFNPNEGKEDLEGNDFGNNNGKPDTGSGNLIESMADVKVVVGKYMTDILANSEKNPVRAKNIRDKAHALAAQGRAEGSKIPVNQHVNSSLSGFSRADKDKVKQYVSANASSILQTDYLQQAMRSWAASLDSGGFMNWSGNGIDGKGGKAVIAHPQEVMLDKVDTKRLLSNIEVSDALVSNISSIMNSISSVVKGMSPTLNLGGNSGGITIQFGDVHNATQQEAQNFAAEFANRIKTFKGGW